MTAPNGSNLFPIAFPTTPLVAEFLQDSIVQLMELINQQCAPVAQTINNGGTFTANGATAVVVPATQVTANSQVNITLKTVGGTPAGAPFLSAITPGTGFSVKSVAGDTSVYNYAVLG